MGMDMTLEIVIQCEEGGFLGLKISIGSAFCSCCGQIPASPFSRLFTLDTVAPMSPQGLSFPASAQRMHVSSCGVLCGRGQLKIRYGLSSSESAHAPRPPAWMWHPVSLAGVSYHGWHWFFLPGAPAHNRIRLGWEDPRLLKVCFVWVNHADVFKLPNSPTIHRLQICEFERLICSLGLLNNHTQWNTVHFESYCCNRDDTEITQRTPLYGLLKCSYFNCVSWNDLHQPLLLNQTANSFSEASTSSELSFWWIWTWILHFGEKALVASIENHFNKFLHLPPPNTHGG